jgi:hypothetical protein
MERVNMNSPYQLVSLLDMLKKYGLLLTDASRKLESITWICNKHYLAGNDSSPSERERLSKAGNHAIEQVRKACLESDMRNVVPEIDRLSQELEWMLTKPEYSLQYLGVSMMHLNDRIRDELDAKHFLFVNESNRILYEAVEPTFNAEVQSKFPSASFDIDEAAKCLALGRSTASVFHLMRVMEIALHAVHACLGITAPITGNDKTWGSVLKKIREDYKSRQNFREKDLFQELYALLDAIRNAWRNSTMHVEDKYNEDEAKIIFQTVKGFLVKLASRMDEQGLPLA